MSGFGGRGRGGRSPGGRGRGGGGRGGGFSGGRCVDIITSILRLRLLSAEDTDSFSLDGWTFKLLPSLTIWVPVATTNTTRLPVHIVWIIRRQLIPVPFFSLPTLEAVVAAAVAGVAEAAVEAVAGVAVEEAEAAVEAVAEVEA
jgi:hypothetical protein